LKLEYDELVSSFAFKFKLRRYNMGGMGVMSGMGGMGGVGGMGGMSSDMGMSVGAYTRPLFGST